ncbi:MAG: aldo/keto reductase [Desulfobacterales bacterium]|nr:aldo/keto reductase [Deltaproteobacteria bacterium]NNK93685.1 aldo/keto reductase [Desulfobacterales bacterium]
MKKRKLGNTGTTVSAVGIGALSFSDFYGSTDTEKSHAILRKALDLGIDHIDTSNVYGAGLSEERIGSFLKDQGGRKNDLFKIATKAGIKCGDDGRNLFDNSSEHLRSELDKSLKRLSVEQVELFYIHRRDPNYPIEEVAGTLAELVKSGKIKQFGFSEIAPTSLQLAADIHPVGAVQSEYSLSTRLPELGLVQRTRELGASLVAFSPVGRSLLTDSPHSFEKSQSIAFLKGNPRFLEPNYSRNIAATDRFRLLAKEMGNKTASLAIAWLLHQGEHILPIPGTRSVSHLEELAAGADLSLSESDLQAIENCLPIGWAHGDRYSVVQWNGPEKYC